MVDASTKQRDCAARFETVISGSNDERTEHLIIGLFVLSSVFPYFDLSEVRC